MIIYFAVQKLFNFMQSHLPIFALISCVMEYAYLLKCFSLMSSCISFKV
jgi:hypothetical protein